MRPITLSLSPKDVHLDIVNDFSGFGQSGNIAQMISLYDKEYPKVFQWMGEVNLNKQALLRNHHQPATKKHIREWKDFMKILQNRDIPITIHSDLGDQADPEKFSSTNGVCIKPVSKQ